MPPEGRLLPRADRRWVLFATLAAPGDAKDLPLQLAFPRLRTYSTLP